MGTVSNAVVADLRAVVDGARVRGPVTDLIDQLLEVCDGLGQAAHTDVDDPARCLTRFLAGGPSSTLALARFGILAVDLPADVDPATALLVRCRSFVEQAERILTNLREGPL